MDSSSSDPRLKAGASFLVSGRLALWLCLWLAAAFGLLEDLLLEDDFRVFDLEERLLSFFLFSLLFFSELLLEELFLVLSFFLLFFFFLSLFFSVFVRFCEELALDAAAVPEALLSDLLSVASEPLLPASLALLRLFLIFWSTRSTKAAVSLSVLDGCLSQALMSDGSLPLRCHFFAQPPILRKKALCSRRCMASR